MLNLAFHHFTATSVLAILLIIASVPCLVLAKKDEPTITSTKFKNALENVFYFEDSDVVLGHDKEANTVYRSADAGETWTKVDDEGQAENAWDLWPHPWDKSRAYILGFKKDHWITIDQGKSWKKFNPQSSPSIFRGSPLNFHGRDAKKVIWNGEVCSGLSCKEAAYYTDDDFKTVHEMGTMTRGCQWAVGTPQFAENIKAGIENRVFCVVEGLYSSWPKDNRLVVSDDYFDKDQNEPRLDGERAVTGVISMASVKNYLVAAAKSKGTDELALYVTDDGTWWHRAEFGQHRIEEDAYTILESTNYSMQVDVLGSKPMNPMGYLFTSNSNGTYFTRNIDHTNRNSYGRVDFEKVAGIQGIVLVNVVDNWKEVERSTLADKDIMSKVSFDDGRTFSGLTVDGKSLHLHSVTDARQAGRIFSSPAPGIVMGVGNTGKFLTSYKKGDLYVSDDAGLTWVEALKGPHLYEFGNQGAVLVAVADGEETSHIQYSIDHGKKWAKADLGKTVKAKFLTTVPDSTTLKFLVMGVSGSKSSAEWQIFKIDFEGLHERSCKKDDFEKWPARVDEDGKASCVMGHKQFYRRRKASADCFIEDEFKDPEPEFEPCVCTKADFECDFNYVRDPEDRSKCNPTDALSVPEGICKNDKDTFKGPSGWRLIPGNECERKGGVELDKEIERPCKEASVKKPASGDIAVEKTKFNAGRFSEWYYLEKGSNIKSDDEVIVMRTDKGEIYITKDHGKTWKPILKGEDVTSIVPNPNNYETVYFLTKSKTVHYTIDRGDRFNKFTAPEPPSTLRLSTLRFHPDYKDWLLWLGSVGSDSHTNVFYSKDRGDDWNTLARYARKCDFIPKEGSGTAKQLIYCEQYEDEDPKKHLKLLSSDNFFADSKVHFNDILDFATMSEFIIVAAKTEDRKSLKVDASVDGQIFAAAEFPQNFHVEHQQAYTVLDSSTHSVFLHVTVNAAQDYKYGTILKSNSNGTSYVLSMDAVNQDTSGYVDFEKMQGLEGVAMVNIVANAKEVQDKKAKKLKSMITHNDGAEWALMPPPKTDPEGKNYKCVGTANKATDKCALHIHSYTERTDKGATFSSASAVGVMMAVGNVGEFLNAKDDPSTDTFITRDGGITWKAAKKGSYMWEYGDQGSIIVIVKESKATKVLYYTLDEGENWIEYEFSDRDMQIDALTTVPSDTSRKFLLWGKEVGDNANSGVYTVSIDFSELKERQRLCELDENKPVNDDYYLWEPRHPLQDSNCLFGHVAQYHRKRIEAKCSNGDKIERLPHKISQNCSCTRQDYECDYNYQIQTDGLCKLVPGLKPQNHEENCKKDPDKIEFYYPTGYRRIPLTTCQGGVEFDKGKSFPCPGHEGEFDKKHGLSGAGLFLAVIIPMVIACGVGYWVYDRWRRQGFGSFGQIRLGENTVGGAAGGENMWISIPVAIISGVVAVARATPLLVMSLWRSAKGYVPVGGGGGGGGTGRAGGIGGRFGRGSLGGASGPYRSRDAFSSRTQDYSQVVEDDELLGDGLEEDEDV